MTGGRGRKISELRSSGPPATALLLNRNISRARVTSAPFKRRRAAAA